MIDIKLLRENPEFIKKNCEVRGAKVDVDAIVALDKEMRELTVKTESLRSERNRLSKECKDKPEARETVKKIKEELALLEPKLVELQSDLDSKMAWLPNLISPETPAGKDDTENREIRKVGTVGEFKFKPKDHQELGDLLGVIDAQRGAKVAKSGFYYWRGKGAQLCNAMFFWTQMELIKKGFTSFVTPCAAKDRTLFGTGYLPFFADQTFKIEKEDLSLIGTSEQTLVAFHTDETLNGATLPLRYCAYS
ncbi:MAG: serine--tRNA ligase, partial [Lentisphaerae bacterium]|nr:serine--tRNA ligase [Lentisphaerota bacterium]